MDFLAEHLIKLGAKPFGILFSYPPGIQTGLDEVITSDRLGHELLCRTGIVHTLQQALCTEDRTINPDLERFMAERMKAHTVEINASHAALLSQPVQVADLILQATHATATRN